MPRNAAFEEALSVSEVAAVSPALEQCGHRRLFGDVWTRPGLTPGEKHWHGASPTTAMTHIACRRHSTGRPSIGWNRSATNSTRADDRVLSWVARRRSEAGEVM